MAEGVVFRISIDGAAATLRAFNKLPRDANVALKDRTGELVDTLVPKVKAAGVAEGSQAVRVSRTVRKYRDRLPSIGAGGGRASGLVFGSEFGMNRKSGWYAAARYRSSEGRQYKPHLGGGSYWFFRTVEGSPEIGAAWLKVADDVAREWAS